MANQPGLAWFAIVRCPVIDRLDIYAGAAEGALRAVAPGRKKYLFSGSDAGGRESAASTA